MTTCEDYVDHEAGFDHEHTGGRVRWTGRDGCSGTACAECMPNIGIVAVAALDDGGLPIDRALWTQGDVLGAIIRGDGS